MELVALITLVAAIFELGISKQIHKSKWEIISFYLGVMALLFLKHPSRLIGFYILFTHQIVVTANRYRVAVPLIGLVFLLYWIELFLPFNIWFSYAMGLLVFLVSLLVTKQANAVERTDVIMFTIFLVFVGPLQNYDVPFTGVSIVVVMAYRYYRNAYALRQSHETTIENQMFYESIVKYSPNSIILTDINGTILFVNDSVTQMTGYSRESLIGKNPKIFKSNETPIEVYEELWDTILSGNIWQSTLKNRRKDGEIYWETLSITPLFNSVGQIAYFLATKNNATEEVKRMKDLENEAYLDHLTGTYRRKYFEHQVKSYRQLNQTMDYLIMMDVDDYKIINDTYGHQIGDVILENLGRLLLDAFEDHGYVGRFGGDEFILFVYGLTRQEISERVESIRKELPSVPVCDGGKKVSVSLSVGMHRMLMSDSLDKALHKADTAMYKDKKRGQEKNSSLFG